MPYNQTETWYFARFFLTWENSQHFRDATTGFPAKWRLRNKRRNSILMTRHYPDLGTVSDWLEQISHAVGPIRKTTQIWVVTHHQYGISTLVSQTSFRGETSGGVAKCLLFCQARFCFVYWLKMDYFLGVSYRKGLTLERQCTGKEAMLLAAVDEEAINRSFTLLSDRSP